MSRYYTQLLKKKGTPGMEVIDFQPNVLERYEGDNGPWKLWWKQSGVMDGISFYYWIRKGDRLEDYEKHDTLTRLDLLTGQEAAGIIGALLKDLASLPASEQEHWRKYER